MLQSADTEQHMTRISGTHISCEVLPGDHLLIDGSCRQDAIIGKPHAG